MFNGDRARKQVLVDYGFRMPSALDNRPLTFEEFEHRTQPSRLCFRHARPLRTHQIRRRSSRTGHSSHGMVDPQIEVRPVKGQVDDLLEEIRIRAERNERVLVTTLTKRMAEDYPNISPKSACDVVSSRRSGDP